MDDINKLIKMIDESNNIVFFSGAGVSTSSGIPDFRSKNGLYNSNKYEYSPEEMLSKNFYYNKTEDFYKFYKDAMNVLEYEPNIVHKYLKKLENMGKLKAIVTQNIDNLHTKAGCKNVYEIHGNINKNTCELCGKKYDGKYVFQSKGIPMCLCGGIIKPDVVLYGEALPHDEYNKSIDAISKADMLIIAGTSLSVYPASSLIDYFNGKYLVIINNDKTNYDLYANLVINEDLKDVFKKLDDKIDYEIDYSIVKTIKNDEDFLRQVSKDVLKDDKDLKKDIDVISEFCRENDVFAMASVQLGIPKKLIYIKKENDDIPISTDLKKDLVMINPEIIEEKGETYFWEACASCLNLTGLVKRPYKVKVEYYDEDFNKKEQTLEGFNATVFSHEYDHTLGILHIDIAEEIKNMTRKERIEFRKKKENDYKIVSKTKKYKHPLR